MRNSPLISCLFFYFIFLIFLLFFCVFIPYVTTNKPKLTYKSFFVPSASCRANSLRAHSNRLVRFPRYGIIGSFGLPSFSSSRPPTRRFSSKLFAEQVANLPRHRVLAGTNGQTVHLRWQRNEDNKIGYSASAGHERTPKLRT